MTGVRNYRLLGSQVTKRSPLQNSTHDFKVDRFPIMKKLATLKGSSRRKGR
jgi:hypothetical protein